MNSHAFHGLLMELLDTHRDNLTFRQAIAHLDVHGEPRPMTDAARCTWRKEVLITAGLRTELHRLTA